MKMIGKTTLNGASISRRQMLLSSAATMAALVAGSSQVRAEVGGTLDYMGWQGEDLPSAMGDFAAQNGITVNPTYIASMDDVDARFAAGGGQGIDLLSVTTSGVNQLTSSGRVFKPLDLDRIPNHANVLNYLLENAQEVGIADAEGNLVIMPHSFGVFGVTYDSAAIDRPEAWSDLLDRSLKGRITMPNDPGANFTLAAHLLGYTPSRVPKDRLDEIADFLKQYIDQCKVIAPSFGDIAALLASGEVVASFTGWAAIDLFASMSGSDTIRTNISPTDGTFAFMDGYAIPQGTDNEDTAYAWINRSLDPQVNAATAIELAAGPTVRGAAEFIDPAMSLYPLDDLETFLRDRPVLKLPPVESEKFITIGEWIDRFFELTLI